MSRVLEQWNRLPGAAAAAEVLPCCGSRAWAHLLAGRRPLHNEMELLAASDAVWRSLPELDWSEAFASHPRIGETRPAGDATGRSLSWSGKEQAAVKLHEQDVANRITEGNRDYEAKFGATFIVCASGRSGREILEILNRRMANDSKTEMLERAEQQRQITHLRLIRWLGEE